MNSENWLIIWENREEFWSGLQTTLILFSSASICAFIIGCLIVYWLEYSHIAFRKLLVSLINTMRMIPFLMLAYLLYYGLPEAINLKMSAWQAGLVALIIYHAAYFAELFRGCRTLLPKGNIEAAYAYGFTKFTLYWRIILPQLLMKARPMLGSQFIYCLKDTAFLNIITVMDLTAAANSISSMYYVPIEAFLLIILIYWIITILIEILIKKCAVFARKRGIEYV